MSAEPFELSDEDRTELVAKAHQMRDGAIAEARTAFGGDNGPLGGWHMKRARQFKEYALVLGDTNPLFLPDEKRAAVGVVRRATV